MTIIKKLFKNERAGSLFEKALLIAFAVFFFFMVVKIVTDLIDILTNEMFDLSKFFLGT